MITEFKVRNRQIGIHARPFIIAEMSGNHNQSLERALAIVDAAAAAGADALKIQTYTADTMTLRLSSGEFMIENEHSLWRGKSLHTLYEEAHTPWDWHKAIFDRCTAHGMIGFSTPFDLTAVEFLESLNVPLYKIASFENADIPLIRAVAATGKPLIISTGMATIAELDETVRAAHEAGATNLVLLKCTSSYPSSPVNSNLRTIPHLRELFGCEVGLSDHTMGVGAPVAAVALGATVIEKHFTLERSQGGVDAAFSLEPAELASLVVETERAWQSLGVVSYGTSKSEESSRQFRRSLYVSADMKPGESFTQENLRAIRPGFGLAPAYYDILMGKRVKKQVAKGTPVSWDLLE
jgi:N-acetylneuraminate synthase